ncbi:Deoxyribonuclease-2-alpha [Trichinella sp. T6]|nr:Deoxyribonuclease-2-alpha [Trichinella sp. T6]
MQEQSWCQRCRLKNRTPENHKISQNTYRVILYKGPAQNTGKLLASDVPGNWEDGARDVAQANGHSFANTLTDVVGNNNNDVKFLAYNNVPPGIPNVKTKSNGKGIIIIRTTVGQNDGAWIVHTVPGFPAARTGYSWPAAEIAKGHLLICMTIAKTQINAIAASLFHAEPFVYYNDIPETETAGMPDFKKLAEAEIPTIPPFTIIRSIKLTGAGAVPVHIYSKSAKSRYEMYKKVILKSLKKTIKVWSRRDNKLKGDCRVPERNIRLIKSPVEIAGHPTNIEADESNWIVSEPGNIFCFMDKPYAKSQATEPALAACFDQAAIFARFNTIAAQFLCFCYYQISQIRKILDAKIQMVQETQIEKENTYRAILYKGPSQDMGKFLASDAPANWVNGAAAVTADAGHSFAVALNDVVRNHINVKFFAYNNVPPGIPNVKTKSNGKGVIMISTAVGVNDGAWIVHTVPGFPAAKTGYSWPAAEIAKGHLLICMTIAETQINAIAASNRNIRNARFQKISKGQIPTTPPFTMSRTIKLTGADAVPVHIYSKSAISRYEFYNKVILKKLTKTIKVYSRRDNKLKRECRVLQRNIRLIKCPAQIVDHPTNVEADKSNWIVSEPGNIFCFMDKPYAKSQASESALSICIYKDSIFAQFNAIAAQTLANNIFTFDYHQLPRNASTLLYCIIHDSSLVIYYVRYSYCATQLLKLCISKMLILCLGMCHFVRNATHFIRTKYFLYFLWKVRAILYKGPAQNNGKLLASDSPNDWANGAAPVTQNNGHSFAVALTNVVGPHANVKFLAYNNVPPAVPNVKTKSNSKGVIIISTAQGENDGAWIVHTVPGFPAAKTGYSWPAAEIAKGHLLICMTIAETQINAVAASLIQIEPFVYYNDIPETETAGMPDFKKLAEGQIPTTPPFTTRRSIKTAAQAPVDIHIYSKSAKSKYEIYKKVIVQALKKSIKVWSRRDNKLKGDCRVYQRNIRLIKSPAQIGDHPTNIEADESNWIVSEPGNIFCFMDKPYSKNQIKEPGIAVCIDKDAIFARFNAIAAQSPEQVELLIKLE